MKFISLLIAIFLYSNVIVSQVSAQAFPFPIPSLPINIGDFSNFNPSDIIDFADDLIPGITDVVGGGTLPTNPTDLFNQLSGNNPLSGVLNGTDLLSMTSQLINGQSGSDVLPNLLSHFETIIPSNMLGTITTFDPNTGLWEIVGAVSGNTSFLNEYLPLIGGNKYSVSTNKTYPASNGKQCSDPYTRASRPDGTVISATGGPLRCNNGTWESTLNIPPPMISTPTPTRPTTQTTGTLPPPPPPQSTITTQPPPPPGASNKGPGFCGCTCKADYKLCPNVPLFGAQCPDHVGQTCAEKLGALACGDDANTPLWLNDGETTDGRNINENEFCSIASCETEAPAFAQAKYGSKGSLSFTLKECSLACLTKSDGSVSCE